jgi:hypothetical protein
LRHYNVHNKLSGGGGGGGGGGGKPGEVSKEAAHALWRMSMGRVGYHFLTTSFCLHSKNGSIVDTPVWST